MSMKWIGLLSVFSCMFLCLGIGQQQQDDFMTRYKRNLNLTFTACLIHQRAIIVPFRKGFGVRALGGQCLCALILMCGWAALTKDGYFWAWIMFWVVGQVGRRVEALWSWSSGAKVHGWYDGTSLGTVILGIPERAMKLFVEPLMVGGLGAGVYWLYDRYHYSPYGLPYFLLAGCVSLPFVEIVQNTIWQNRTQSIVDSRVEQEALMRDFRNRYGN
jgi:hypothetical protein